MTATAPDPIFISPGARKDLTTVVQEWTGWPKAKLHIGGVPGHAAAMCLYEEKMVRVDLDKLILNPNRVLLTVNPFRMRQEGVLTGALMHEAAHARYTRWKPRTAAEIASKPLLHGDGTEATALTVNLARLLEEPRIEYRILAQAGGESRGGTDFDRIGPIIRDLGWTMRAMASHVVQPTQVRPDPDQAVMDVLGSWTLRAGRLYGYREAYGARAYTLPDWVAEFDSLLYTTIKDNLVRRVDMGAALDFDYLNPHRQTQAVMRMIKERCRDDNDTGMAAVLDNCKAILELLFPETPAEAGAGGGGGTETPVTVSGGCASTGAGTSTEQNEGEPGEGEPGEGEPDEGDGEGDEIEALTKAVEASARGELEMKLQALEEGAEKGEAEEAETKGRSIGGGPPQPIGGGWRNPTKEEREIHREAERFLRELIEPNEMTARSLSEQPSAMVDGAALSAWKAGGQTRDPHFFVRTRRSVEPTPPVQIAVLVDVSSSMDEMQKPSALLSWALASAALDLRNFAGRGTQVESCLIHWGTGVRVIQKPGEVLRGIREVDCDQGTAAMHTAMEEVEEMMPGFFDPQERPVNRLLVQFTDWGLWNPQEVTPWIRRALASGVNMLSVIPKAYSYQYSPLTSILNACPVQNGSSSLVPYKGDPQAVWTAARSILRDPTVQMQEPTGFEKIF